MDGEKIKIAYEVCNKKCPEHGDRCKVMRASKEDKEMAMALFGCLMDFENHVHLCLADVKKPHTWVDASPLQDG